MTTTRQDAVLFRSDAGLLLVFKELTFIANAPARSPVNALYRKFNSKKISTTDANANTPKPTPTLSPPDAVTTQQNATRKLTILNSVSGIIRPGRLTVILGPSGSGKTTLLSAIAGMKAPGCKVSGKLEVNQKAVPLNYFRAMAGFVHQEDVIMGTMTVEEAIRMSLCLRSKSEPSEKSQRARIEEVLEMLSLQKARNTLIGTTLLKGVSGGEKKRAAIGMEIVANPPILFLDECTSGLDTFSAFSVVAALKKIAASGITVVATLHQPSSEIFELIDDLIILSSGNILYQGEALLMVEYFSALGYTCPPYNNPPDFVFMKVIGQIDNASLENLIAAAKSNGNLTPKPCDVVNLLSPYALSERLKNCPSFSRQLKQLLKRNLLNCKRDALFIYARIAQFIFVGLLTGVTYNQFELSGSPADVAKNTAGLMFFISTNLLLGGAITTMAIFSIEQVVFVREYTAGFYGTASYFTSKIAMEIPLQILLPCVFSATAYWLVGLPSEFVKFVVFCLACSIINMTGTSIGMLVASCFKDILVALAVLPVVLLPAILMGGILVVNNVSPKAVIWIQWISPIQYTFGSLCQNYLNDRNFVTTTGELFNGEVALKMLGVSDRLDIHWNFTFSCLILFVTQVLAFFALYWLAERSGGSPFLSYMAKRRIKKIASHA